MRTTPQKYVVKPSVAGPRLQDPVHGTGETRSCGNAGASLSISHSGHRCIDGEHENVASDSAGAREERGHEAAVFIM